MLRHLVALAVVSCSTGRAALAQNAAGQRDSTAWLTLEHRVNGQALIRVRGDWGSADLSKPRFVGDTLTYAADQSPLPRAATVVPRPLTLVAVDRIQVRHSAAGTGALVGAGVGLAAGLAAGLAFVASECSGGGCNNEVGGTVVIALGSTIGGALLGALIGAPLKKWKTVYPYPTEQQPAAPGRTRPD